MKNVKRITALFLCLMITLFVFASCKPSEQQGGNNQNTQVNDENVIFSVDVQPKIICNQGEELATLLEPLQMAVFRCTYRAPEINADDVAESAHEIVVGKSNRKVSETAYRYLERLEPEEGEVSYLIYSNGKSVAIAYDEDRYQINATLIRAVESLVEFCDGKASVVISKGTFDSLSFDALEYQEEIDAKETEAQWRVFEAKVNAMGGDGAAITAAVKDYYARVCTDNVISWFANLYDPAIGGYYFSNSARNTPGFLPDAESTSQALGQFTSSGMASSLKEALPDWMEAQVIAFLKSLQDPETGYFYHPQWTKAEVDAHTSRRSRDMTKSIGILNELGSAPTYDTPTGDKGDGIKWDGTRVYDEVLPASTCLTGRLSDSGVVLAVSKVVPTASVAVADHLKDAKAFKTYLDEFAEQNAEGSKSFYSIGNTIGSQLSEIVYRDEQLGNKLGSEGSLGKILVDWYTEHQNKETGLWDNGVNYDATNALLKIVGTFDTFGVIFPNADKAMESCVTMLTSEDEALTVCYVYNVWYALLEVLNSVDKYSKSQVEIDKAKEIRTRLLELAPQAIKVSADKQLQFKYEDGSFSFEAGAPCLTSQGLRVAPQGEGCGDVNSTVICMGGTINHALRTMGLNSVAPGYFTKADLYRYIAILEDLEPVIKDDIDVPIDYATFDDETVGNIPISIDSTIKEGSLVVTQRPGGEYGDNAAQFTTVAGSGDNLKVLCQTGALTASCFVFEGDFMIESTDPNVTIMQVLMQDSVYMINLVEKDGKVQLLESSSTSWSTAKQTDLLAYPAIGEWFSLKIEYYPGDHDTVRIKVYFNGDLIAITDNYMDKSGAKLTGIGTPADSMDFTSLIGISTTNAVVYVDNLACYKTANIYKPPKSKDDVPPICIDPPDNEEIIYTFDDEKIPEEFKITENDANVSLLTVEENTLLSVSGAKSAAVIALPINVRTAIAKCAVFDADLLISGAGGAEALTLCMSENPDASNALVCFRLGLYEDGGELYARVVEAPDGKSTLAVEGASVKIDGKFNLRIEYYEDKLTTLIYINEVLVGISDSICKYANKYTVKYLTLTGSSETACSVGIDDLIFEKNVIKFETAAEPEEEQVVNSFAEIPEGAETQNASPSANGLKFTSSSSSLKMALNERGNVANVTVVSAKMTVDSGTGSYLYTLLSSDGREIICLEIEILKDTLRIYEYYAGGRGAEIGSAYIVGRNFDLVFEYYHDRTVCNVTVDGKPLGATALTYLYERDSLIPAYVSIKQMSDTSSVYVSEFVAENIVKAYSKLSVTPVSQPETEGVESFETSSYRNYSKSITSSLDSVGADLAIKAMMKNGEITRMLALRTENGGNDQFNYKMNGQKKLEGASVTVFSADILLDTASYTADSGVQINLKDGNDTVAWRISLYFEEGEPIKADDYKKPSSTYSKLLNVNEGTIFNLRIEYTVTDGEMIVNLFVNGICAGTSKRCYQDSPIAASEITKISFYTVSAAVGCVLVDNIDFYQTNVLSDATVPETPPTTDPENPGTEDPETPGEGGESAGGDPTPGNPGSFDNIGEIPEAPDGSPEYDGDSWT